MAKTKTIEIGGVSFTEEGYELFKKKTKESQIEEVYNSLNPKDRDRAVKLLTHIPHGNISSRVQPEASEDNQAGPSTGNGKDNPKGRRADTEKGKD